MVDTELRDNIQTSANGFANGDAYDFNTMSRQLIALKEMCDDGIVTSFGVPDYNDFVNEKTLFDLGVQVTQYDEVVNPEFASVGELKITDVNGESIENIDISDIVDTFNAATGKNATAFKAAMAVALTANSDESLANAIRGPTGP